MTDPFADIRAVADAVLYEGYVLYPYRASAKKNQVRWQFGVLMPPAYVVADPSERADAQTEVVFEASENAVLQGQLRFLQVRRRSGGGRPDWDETVQRNVDFAVSIAGLDCREFPFAYAGGISEQDGLRRESCALAGSVLVSVEPLPGPYGARRLTAAVRNETVCAAADRDAGLPRALIAAHVLLFLEGGHFLSMTDPPEWAAPDVADCVNSGLWPVLGDSPSVVLAAPIILEDNPRIAPESPGDLYDGTEIDEILTLRTMALTDTEKAEARATDPRAAAVIDQVDGLPAEHLDRLHGALRYLRQVTEPTRQDAPWWDPGADTSVSPETDVIEIAGVPVRRGSKVRLHPGARRADAQDLFLCDEIATVQAVFLDVDGQQHLAVTPDRDPQLAEIQRWHGRYLYFAPDEVDPIGPGQ